MPRFSANLSMMFTEYVFLERFEAARDAGFEAVEFLFPYDHAPDDIGQAVRSNELAVSVFNLPPGNWEAGDRGLAALTDRADEFRISIETALPYANAVGAERVHVMAGIVDEHDKARASATYVENLRFAADRLGDAGLDVLIEPLNHHDMPGYFLDNADLAANLIETVGAPNLKLQFDVYHQQINQGDITRDLERLMPLIGHVQIAGVPDRHEPDGGELNYAHVFRRLDALDYSGWVGCEYRPRSNTTDGLGWMQSLL